MQDLSIYIHYPFCQSKCPYCDFNSHIAKNIDYQGFKKSYIKELEFFASKTKGRIIKTIYFGGGTPSLMPLDLVEEILNKISQFWKIDKKVEITFETNPSSFEVDKFFSLKNIGINRISIGVQSFNEQELKFLGRAHSSNEAVKAIKSAQKIFDNQLSFDLIYSLPNQSEDQWKANLSKALSFETNHLSLYQLTIEKGTKFFRDERLKRFIMPNNDLSADFYLLTNKIMKMAGFVDYEISNYAKAREYHSKHNLNYWRLGEYIGIGAGAHSRIKFDGDNARSAIMMIHEPRNWLNCVSAKGNGIQNINKVTQQELLEELILMNLRLKEGIKKSQFKLFFNKRVEDVFDLNKLRPLIQNNMITLSKNFIKVNSKSRIITNQITSKLVYAIVIN